MKYSNHPNDILLVKVRVIMILLYSYSTHVEHQTLTLAPVPRQDLTTPC